MKNRILSLFALAAVFAGCAKDADPTPAPVQDAGKFVIEATIGQDTKLSYTEKEDHSYSATFNSSEVISVFLYGEDNSLVGNCDLPIDYYSISDDGKKAKFETTKFTLPENAVKMEAYMHSGSAVNYSENNIPVDLSSQKNVGEAQGRHILFGTCAVADIKTEDGVAVAKVQFAYKTSLLRFNIKLKGYVPMSNAVVTISGEGIHNKLYVQNGEIADTSKVGSIVLGPTTVNKEDSLLVAHACVWSADNFKDAKIVVENDEETFEAALELKKETFEAGKVYDVTRSLTVKPRVINVWKNDEAGSMDYPMGLGQNKTSDWLVCENGLLSWTANETGAPRSATISFENGAGVTITQLAPADFKGSWSLFAKVFASAGAAIAAADPATVNLESVEARVSTPLKAADGIEYTNTFGLTGLCGSAVLDVCAVVDYDNMTVKIGLLLDTREGAGQDVDGKLVVFYPGLATLSETSWGKPWSFAVPEQGNPDFSYLWLTGNEDLKTFVYKNRTSADIPLQTLSQYSDASMNAIVGFGVGIASDSAVGEGSFTTYSNFFQLNPKGYEGLTLVRK